VRPRGAERRRRAGQRARARGGLVGGTLEFAGRNARLNAASVETILCSWTAPQALLERAPFDLVLASDVLYERRNVDPLLGLLPRLAGEVLLADPGRPALRQFLDGATASWRIDGSGPLYRLLLR